MQWISVKEKLPPQDGTPFLGYDPSKDDLEKIYVLVFEASRTYAQVTYPEHYLEASGEGYFQWEPTHWMPLPEAPIEPKTQNNIGACNLVSRKVSPEYAQILRISYETFRDAIDDQAKNWISSPEAPKENYD